LLMLAFPLPPHSGNPQPERDVFDHVTLNTS
jgi:hypothetical protein